MDRLPSEMIDPEPISHDASGRIQQVLKHRLIEELALEGYGDGAEDSRPELHGPWSLLVGSGDPWDMGARPSPELFARIRGEFSGDTTREVLLAAGGVKVSRTYLSDEDLEFLLAMAGRHGFSVAASPERYVPRPDAGKGGYSNRMEPAGSSGGGIGLRKVYVASDVNLAESARLLEEAGDDFLFGMLLGIPACCREAFMRHRATARAKQYDLTPMVLSNTRGPMPYDPWLNRLASYFGHSLLSFSPCSFRCPAAAAVARSTFDLLAGCDEAWARSFLDLQHSNILYTEYQGLHRFRRPFVHGSIHYGPGDYDSTEPTDVSALIGRGDRLEVRGKHEIDVYRRQERIGRLEGPDVGICVFV